MCDFPPIKYITSPYHFPNSLISLLWVVRALVAVRYSTKIIFFIIIIFTFHWVIIHRYGVILLLLHICDFVVDIIGFSNFTNLWDSTYMQVAYQLTLYFLAIVFTQALEWNLILVFNFVYILRNRKMFLYASISIGNENCNWKWLNFLWFQVFVVKFSESFLIIFVIFWHFKLNFFPIFIFGLIFFLFVCS